MTETVLTDGQNVDTGGGGSWTDGFKDESIKTNEVISGFEGPEQLATEFLGLQAKIPVVPENIDGYSFEVPEGVTLNEEANKAFREHCHKAGLTQEQYQAMVQVGLDNDIKSLKAAESQAIARKEADINSLKDEYGGEYDAKIETAKKAVRNVFAPEFAEFLNESGLGNHPAMVRAMVKIGEHTSEDTWVSGKGNAPPEMGRTSSGMPQLSFPSMDK